MVVHSINGGVGAIRSDRTDKTIDAISAHQGGIRIGLQPRQFCHQIFIATADPAIEQISRNPLAGADHTPGQPIIKTPGEIEKILVYFRPLAATSSLVKTDNNEHEFTHAPQPCAGPGPLVQTSERPAQGLPSHSAFGIPVG